MSLWRGDPLPGYRRPAGRSPRDSNELVAEDARKKIICPRSAAAPAIPMSLWRRQETVVPSAAPRRSPRDSNELVAVCQDIHRQFHLLPQPPRFQ